MANHVDGSVVIKAELDSKELEDGLKGLGVTAGDVGKGMSEGVKASADKTKKEFEGVGDKAREEAERSKEAADSAAKAAQVSAIASCTAIVAALVAVGKAAFDAAVEYESAFAGVEKTVDGTAQELQAISDGIRRMALEIPATASEIAAVAEAAGQLGIATENVLSFTRVMTDLGVATNMSADQAATALARFANITGMAQGDFDRLGASVVALGNTLATTESEIVDMALGIAAAGSQVGMTEAQILAFAGSLSSVGMEAAAGGTAISRMMINMQLAAETGADATKTIEGMGYSLRELELMADQDSKKFKALATSLGLTTAELKGLMSRAKDLENFSSVLGMTAEEFKAAFGNDAAGVLQQFIDNLGDVEKNGKSAIAVLDDMGISEVRVRDALLRLSGAMEVMTGAQETSTKAWDENTALIEEAEKRYQTLESRMTMMGNAFTELGIVIGDGLTKPVGGAVDLITKLAAAFADFLKENEGARDLLVAIGTALATFFAALGGYLVIQEVISSMQALWAVMAANPVLLAAAAVAALAAGLYILKQNAEDSQAELKALISEVDELKKKSEESAKAFEETQKSVENNAAKIAVLVEKIQELAKNTERTSQETWLLKAYISELNQIVPELNLAFDEQTGVLSKTSAELDNLAESYKAAAVEAAAMARTQELALQMLDFDLKREDIKKQLEPLEEAYAKREEMRKSADILWTEDFGAYEQEALLILRDLLDEVDEGYAEAERKLSDVADAAMRIKDQASAASGATKSLSGRVDGLTSAYKSGEISAQEYLDSLNDLRKIAVAAGEDTTYLDEAIAGAAATTEGMAAALRDSDEAAKEFVKRVTELAGITGNAFSQIEQASSTSLKEMQANINGNRDAMRDYYATLAELDKRGMELGLGSQVFEYMKSLGPEMVGTLKEALAEGDEAFKQFFEDYKQSQADALLYTKYEYG